MAFPKYHGITLANNSWIENAHFERLTADPVPVQPGRVWFNTTEKKFKFSGLNAGGSVIVYTFATAAELADEVARATAAEADLQAQISSEIAARIAANAALTQALADETAARIAAVQAETDARVAADQAAAAAASDQLATETAARLAGDAALGVRIDGVQAELNATQAGAGLNADGTFTAPENTQYLGEATNLKDIGVKLDQAIVDEKTARIAGDAALASALANEAQLRADGDAALQATIESWVQTQIALDNTTDEARVAAEAALRIAKDDALQAELDRTQAAIGLDTDGNLIPITGTNFLDGATSVFAGAFALDAQLKVVTDGLAAEAQARSTADQNFLNQLQAEKTRAQGKEDALQQELNTTQAGAGLEADGSYATPTGSNYLNGAVSLKDADYFLDAAIKVNTDAIAALQASTASALAAETAARTAADNALDARVTTVEGQVNGKIGDLSALTTDEKGTIVGAINELDAGLASEVAARTSAVAALQAADQAAADALAAEVQRAQGVEGDLADLTTTEKSNLVAAINEVSVLAGQGTDALKTAINDKRFTYASPIAALEHTVAHNLNAAFVSFSVLVEGSDGKYRNDVVPVEETNANTLTISLAESRRIKVTVQDVSDLA
jgi:hypothetical protein